MSEQRNLILAVVLSMAILFGFQMFVDKPASPTQPEAQNQISQALTPEVAPKPAAALEILQPLKREEALIQTPRITIHTPKVKGSINLKGAQIDDLRLSSYRETPNPESPEITLLSPINSQQAYSVTSSFQGLDEFEVTLWKIKEGSNAVLRPDSPVTLVNEAKGVHIERTISIDEDYLFTITDSVTNQSTNDVNISAQSLVERRAPKQESELYILHEGAVGVINGRLQEIKYSTLNEGESTTFTSKGGWAGFTDKYWLVAVIPAKGTEIQAHYSKSPQDTLICRESQAPVTLKSGQTHQFTQHIFAGAKVLRLLDNYEEKHGFERFDLAVDFGWFYFLTKPLFYVLEYLNSVLGSMGLAIVIITVLSKILFYPLSKKSFKSMARMRDVGPKMEKLRQMYGADKARLNQEMMTLYQKEGVNPASGCLPQLAQAPIFFCLYKVFYVTIEMRQAPFLFWIHDLAIPDPTQLFNLFGLIPFTPPSFLQIGIWPLIMGVTMLIQQRMGPQPADPAQAKMMLIMPIMFTFLFSGFPAGVVIYWTFSNLIGIAQQWYFTNRAFSSTAPATTGKKKR